MPIKKIFKKCSKLYFISSCSYFLTLVDEDDLPSVYLRLREIQDTLLRRLLQRHHPADRRLDVVNQLLYRSIQVLGFQHAGGDVSCLPSENLCDMKDSGRGGQMKRLHRSLSLTYVWRNLTQATGQEFIGKLLEAAWCVRDKIMLSGAAQKYQSGFIDRKKQEEAGPRRNNETNI